ncbi:MAG TPA: tripartite tricarboxylate transporter substrate-binding protein [Xanthobacteraceae bacterium]
MQMLRIMVGCAGILLGTVAAAAAEVYPSRVITIVVPLPPGGATDTLTRTLADHMRGTLGQPVIVENAPGAGGTLGVARVVRAAPDGYTLSIGNWATHTAAAATYPVHYDVLTDLAPVAKLADTPLWMVVKAALPVRDLKGLIAWLKANPDHAAAGIVGYGSGGHICGLSFQNATGTRYQFVPYRGGAPAMHDLVAGQIDFMCDMAANSLPQARAGTIKPIVVMSKRRWFAAPEVPTAEEMGVPGLALSLWHGMWAPKGTPTEIIARLNAAVVAALADPAVRERFAAQGQELPPPEQQTPEGFAAYHRAEAEKWWPIIKAANIKNE